ncbi:NDT80 / PhoG like DNA-binding family protein [Aspergillus clavatus NRRL 1]|uniref:NDT80 / PhoG like DNA-binding family protein n=1 Tax=Aspergillus clavatus (strain ATCC 1007 / CBS 513.65 / DSM 816 / NCTC 3887 / NRRL 1 / QM 1276 / 107) TaxID=344612 RepID=A1C647_ASPCL|nr:NDT80 / PhoG like DNA-binding family protein [Aspergillus clavatus NRRL 1]EAW13868.1 NDT80 / PhoG like DNA-binding family protein [Aspergillus clavatus NRRL 1]
MSSALQPQISGVSGNSALLGRNESYSNQYALQRGSQFPSISSLSDTLRIPPYTSTPRALDNTFDRSHNLMFGQAGSLYLDPPQRLPQPVADAPSFHETSILLPIVAGSQAIKPEIHAKIHKGFFQVDDKWTCYRRNYFSVSCSFSLHPWTLAPLYLKVSDRATERTERILKFSMCISAVVNANHGEIRELVQHTPKRDKQSERKPGKVILQPCQPTPLGLNHAHAAASNSSQHAFAMASHSAGLSMDYGSSYTGAAPPPSQPPTQHTFERIQFQKATANNGKRRAQQQYYNLVVELYAEVTSPNGGSETQWLKVARRLSHPMVVRGRSPGHYKDGRRDSSTSMGPDGGTGGFGDGGVHPGLGPTTRSHMTLMFDPAQRGGAHYGRTDYHHMTEQSPLGGSPHIPSSASSTFDIGILNESMDPMNTIKSTTSMEMYPDASFALIDRKPEGLFRTQLAPFEYDTLSRGSEESGHSYPESFDSMTSLFPSEASEASHILKHPPRLTPHLHHIPSSSDYDPLLSSRSNNDGSYSRFSNSQGLCA